MIFIDNRPGEANPIPIVLPLPAGMISDLDGKTLRAFMTQNGGQAQIRVSSSIEEIQTGRSGIITSFSSAGPTDFGYLLKPDIAAPGLDVLSSTPPRTTGSNFAVFAGTSMATPHVAGAAAVLIERHPDWSPWQVKSALMSTASAAWGDTARTQEASVLLEGAGLANVSAADDPKIFTAPQSLSFARIDVTHGAQIKSMLVLASDAGDGAGTWSVTVAPQTQTNGVEIDVPQQITIGPGGDAAVPVIVRVAANAGTGENTGFVELSGAGVTRRIPYSFLVERPALENMTAVPLQKLQTGSTATGTSHVSAYCCPSAPFGQPPNYVGPAMNEDGSEHLYWTAINEPAVNFGVSVLAESPGALIDPFVLGSKDENDVQGYAGIPTDVNSLTYDSQLDIGAAGAQFPRLQRFYVAVDSRADPFTNQPLKGSYLLNAWINDVTPPSLRLLTTRVSAGRPLIVAQAVDAGAGVDPLSLVLSYQGVLIGASAYDPFSGLALFGLPSQAPKLRAGTTRAIIAASDYQEAKNIDTVGTDLLPNTAFKLNNLKVVNGPAVTWIEPPANACAITKDRLVAVAGSTTKITKVQFFDGTHLVGTTKNGPGGIFSVPWSTGELEKGKHSMTAVAVDRSGRKAVARRQLRVCK
jgi:Subtilase family